MLTARHLLHPSNLPPTVAGPGVELKTAFADSNQEPALLRFATDNIVLEHPQLTNVIAPHVKYLLDVAGANITVKGLVSSGCTADSSVLLVQRLDDQSRCRTSIANARFSNCNMRAVKVTECSSYVVNSDFDGMAVSNGDGAAILAGNLASNGAVNLTNCTFLNNKAIEIAEPHQHLIGCVALLVGRMHLAARGLCVGASPRRELNQS